jgi:D-lactate dehydrogenase (cytochrome)
MDELIAALRRVVGPGGLVAAPDALQTYAADASMIVARAPQLVALPADAAQAAEVVRLALAAGLPVVARGAGTGIAGGAVPVRGGLVLSTARMDQVAAIDARSRCAVVGPGVVNAELNARLAPLGLQFAPDPSSQRASTIGGNLATNAGGPHCLKHGVTANHVLAVELLRADGVPRWTGDGTPDAAGYDLTGLVVGSEGTFGVVTAALVRLSPLPEANRVVLALFPSVVAASAAVSRVIAAGSLPTSLEVMDHNAIRAVNGAYGLGLPEGEGATLLIVEVDGVEEGLDEALAEILAICRASGAFELRPARTAAEQAQVWAARKAVAGAIGRLAPAYLLVDTVVPRTRLPLMMEHIERLRREHGMEVCNVFHAGDGNLHPLVLYDPRDAEQVRRAHAIAEAVLELSIAQGGVISGEHGVGLEKREYLPLLLSPCELQLQAAVHHVFDPGGQFNPAKIFPAGRSPRELAEERRARMLGAVDGGRGGQGDTGRGGQGDGGRGGQGDTGSGGEAGVAPESIEGLAAVVAACHRGGIAVVPVSSLSDPLPNSPTPQLPDSPTPQLPNSPTPQLPNSPTPQLPDSPTPQLRIATTKLTRVLTYEPDDLTIGVEAGVTLAQLQGLLARNGQMLPLEVFRPEAATLGALAATAAEGPRRLGYGTLRDWALGLTVVEPDGTVSRLGAQVVKNVTGYDLVKLFVGSRGTLGVIAAVSLRVFPRPPASATLAAAFGGPAAAVACLDELAGLRLQPTAAELIVAPLPGGQSGAGATLAVRAEGREAAVARHARDLAALAARHGGACRELRGADEDGLWASVAALAGAPAGPGEAVLRLCAPPAALGAALDAAADSARALGLELRLTARALSGVAYLRASGAVAGLRALHGGLVGRWRHAHLLDGAPELLAGADRWGAPPPGLALMRALKEEFDPCGRMRPGSYIV